jgi:hypothetical protein
MMPIYVPLMNTEILLTFNFTFEKVILCKPLKIASLTYLNIHTLMAKSEATNIFGE